MGDNPFEEPSSSHNQKLLNSGGSRSYGGSGGYQPKEVFGDSFVDAEAGGDYKPDLQFQTFQHTSQQPRATSGTISHSGGHGGGAIIQPEQSTVVDFEEVDDKQPITGHHGGGGGGEGNPPSGGDAPPPPESVNAKIWSINYYKPLFNVDTAQVLQRILRSLTPFRFGFIETARSNPDFYGPFWISTTLIFVLAIFGNLSNTINHAIDSFEHKPATNSTSSSSSSTVLEGFTPDFGLIVVGSAVFYGYTIVIPLVLWGVFKYLAVPVKLLEVICIYGYSIFIFVPVSLVCVIPNGAVKWVITILASAWSGFFLVSNLLVVVKDIAFKRGLIAMACVGGLHIALGLTYRLYFFGKAYKG